MTDFTTITACGECCTGCPKKQDGRCPGCIEADGHVPEWAGSGRCKVHACTREHHVQFCGLCAEFPCGKLPEIISWNPDIVAKMTSLRDEYRQKQACLHTVLTEGCMKQSGIKTILVTAFEPFGGEKLNPTEKLLGILPETIGGYSIQRLLLPVEFKRAPELAIAQTDTLRPDAVLMLGQAGGRSAITPETAARNEMNARIPDNAGFRPEHLPVMENGPAVLYSALPVERIVRAVSAAGIPCETSGDAGTFVCNALFYRMLSHVNGNIPAGFIHVPYIREQGHPDKPFLEFDAIRTGITATIEAVARIVG